MLNLNCRLLTPINIQDINSIFPENFYNKPAISDRHLKLILKKAVLYRYILERQDEFNLYVKKAIDIVYSELSNTKDIELFIQKHEKYGKKLPDYLIDNFWMISKQNLARNIEFIDQTDISIKSSVNNSDLLPYQIGNISKDSNLNLKLTDLTHKNCLRDNLTLSLYVSLKHKDNSNIERLGLILDQVENLSKDKLYFDKRYISNLIYLKRYRNTDILGIIKSINSCINMVKNPARNIKTPIEIPDNFDEISIDLNNEIITYFDKISDSNLIIYSSSDLNRILLALCLEDPIIEKINSLLYNKEEEIKSNIVKFAFTQNYKPLSPLGYAQIDI